MSSLDSGRLVVQRSWSGKLKDFGHPKGGRPREVPLSWDATAALRGLANVRNPKSQVFWPQRLFSQSTLRRVLNRTRKAARLDKHVHTHMLRHTWASHCILKGIPSRVVMLWGGWENEEMLKQYAHLAPREVETLIHRIAPPGAPLRVVKAPPTDRLGHHRGTAKTEDLKTGS
ncbi:MAG: tyrosine-type recombinase/integrase [Myxococcota bacterium]